MKTTTILIASISILAGSLCAGQYSSSLDNHAKQRLKPADSNALLAKTPAEASRQYSANGKRPQTKHAQETPSQSPSNASVEAHEKIDSVRFTRGASSLRRGGNGRPRGSRS
ncbi:hypothetical protein [Pelagicoccus sp. SDUM812003]|uniref:hypothetical protein n=1 Tax=Pelagicoccus sp. SDUM812003 TaxID=3041267 RepID=UPI00280FDF39|nr:hypothetical protein [Pelagicoccus sp. SDUM812003]MDQ8204317.1 hypothetical protein [Pelagicoccus sp. SDUM812003]